MFETGIGIRNPLFFIGVVEDVSDGRLEGRVRVRAFGVHGTNRDIPADKLPWATVVSGSYDANVIPQLNSWVFGVFLDGRDAQKPMILGLVPTQLADPIDPEANGWGVIPEGDAETTARGSRPRDIGQPQNSRLMRGENIEETYVAQQEASRVTDIPVAGSEGEGRWSEPNSAYNAEYPKNRVIESASGETVIELDDTDGAERVMIWHRSGSYVQVDTRGTRATKTVGDNYDVMDRNQHVYVGGQSTVTIEGDSRVLVRGNKIEEIEGDYFQYVRGNHMISVAGVSNINASESVQIRAANIKIHSNVSDTDIIGQKNVNITSNGYMIGLTGASDGINLKATLGSINIHSLARNVNISAALNTRIQAAAGQLSLLAGAAVAVDAVGIISLANGLAAINPAYAFAFNSYSAIPPEMPEPIAKGIAATAHRNHASMGSVGYGSRDEGQVGYEPNIISRAALESDPEWQAELAALRQEFPGLEEDELYRIIGGESSFNTRALNFDPETGEGSRAAGFFQFIPDTAAELGTSTEEILGMSPAEQLSVYRRYLRNANYTSGPLGMIQAAPSRYRNLTAQYGSWAAIPRNIEVYGRDTSAWAQNPGWRGPDGTITIGSIEAYYARQ